MVAATLIYALAAGSVSQADIEAALTVAEELERHRAYDAARRQYRAIIALHPATPRAADLEVRVCTLWQLEGDDATAEECLAHLEPPGTTSPGRATLNRARVMPPDARDDVLLEAVRSADPVVAEQAWLLLGNGWRARRGPAWAAERLAQIAPELPEPLRIPSLARAAMWYLEGGDAARALPLAQAVAQHRGAWWDDAQITLARARRATGDRAGAVAAYREILDGHESSLWVGSYTSAHFFPSMLEGARVLMELERLDEASTWLDASVAEGTRWEDDVAHQLAQIAARRGDTNALREFVAQYPRSPFAQAAQGRE